MAQCQLVPDAFSEAREARGTPAAPSVGYVGRERCRAGGGAVAPDLALPVAAPMVSGADAKIDLRVPRLGVDPFEVSDLREPYELHQQLNA